MFYYIIYLILAIISLSELIETPKSTKKAIYTITIIFFIVLGGLRWRTGSDWFPYYNYYTRNDVDDPFFVYAMEPGFGYFVKFLRLFSQNFTFYLIALSVVTIGFKGIFFYKFTKAFLLAGFLYWCTLVADITAVRQAMAIAICAISTLFIVEKKPWQFAILVALAAQIHVTAYVFLLAYKVYFWNWSVRSKYIFLVCAILFGVTVGSEKILESIISIVPPGLGLDRITSKAQSYMELGNEFGGAEAAANKLQRTVAAVLKRAILLPIFFLFQDRFSATDKNFNGFLNLYTFGNVLYFIFIDFLTMQRSATYFYLFEILIFCIIFDQVKSKTIWLLIILLYGLSKLTALLIGAEKLLIPYIWIFSENTYRFES